MQAQRFCLSALDVLRQRPTVIVHGTDEVLRPQDTALATLGFRVVRAPSAGTHAERCLAISSNRCSHRTRSNDVPSADYVIVGSGLTGSTIARLLADDGREVVVLERRTHVGGNVHDSVHQSGIRFHTYGPHYFRTGSERIWAYVTRFSRFYPFEAAVLSRVAGIYYPWPVNRDRLAAMVGGVWGPLFSGVPANFEEACLAVMPRLVFDTFIRGYTEKQWGVPVASLGTDLAARITVRRGSDARLMPHRHQGLPADGYERFMLNMLQGIPTFTGVDYLSCQAEWRHKRTLVYTGGIDELFGYSDGMLTYRGQNRVHSYYPDKDYLLPCGQINEPDARTSHIRQIEWKHLMDPSSVRPVVGTVITAETPCTPTDPNMREYPFPDARNQALYARYAARAAARCDLTVCGRLGEYRYYDMDQAIGRAMKIARTILLQRRVLSVTMSSPAVAADRKECS